MKSSFDGTKSSAAQWRKFFDGYKKLMKKVYTKRPLNMPEGSVDDDGDQDGGMPEDCEDDD